MSSWAIASVRDDATLVVSELVTNAVHHSGGDEDDELELRVGMTHAGITISAPDAGRSASTPILRRRGSGAGGLGLHIVAAIAGRWRVECESARRVGADIPLEAFAAARTPRGHGRIRHEPPPAPEEDILSAVRCGRHPAPTSARCRRSGDRVTFREGGTVEDASHSSSEWKAGELSCTLRDDGAGTVRVTVSGELDLLSAPALEARLAAIDPAITTIVLDLSGLTFMDSTGLGVIVVADARRRQAGGRLALVPGARQIQRLFEITGLQDSLQFVTH